MPSPGELLAGRYRIVAPLGSGGMATVHRARDERLDRDVAIKVLLPNHAGDPATAARFEREARSLAAASPPSVVAIYDVDAGDPAAGREPFFVMELCPGGSLAARMAGGRRMSPDELIPILVSVADGLADLHRRGVVHRDVKPQNILFAADRAKLADFGLALADDREGLSELTAPGTAVGTLNYLAPEVLAGDRASAAADVYALGVVAFVALTGEWPRPAGSMAELVAAAQAPARRLSSAAPEIGPAFDDLIAA
ncbi:MAG TPA: serine/threonine-protein kinase, partial [Candidatus Limnocylindrales bacterium]